MENASAHNLGMAAMYARVVIRVARIVPTLMTVLQLAVGRIPQLMVGRVHALAHFPPTAVRLPARPMQSLLARSNDSPNTLRKKRGLMMRGTSQ
jgi:hypothetical protein